MSSQQNLLVIAGKVDSREMLAKSDTEELFNTLGKEC